MKQIFALMAAVALCHVANSQLVLNEIYPDPGKNNNEFFELYNTGTVAESANNYTLVTYFNTSSMGSGFYVLDLPNLTVAGNGFFVGASASPFSYQKVANSTQANFNWNDKTWLANNEGSLTEWKLSSSNLGDGNLFYDKVTVPSNLNDLFVRMTGNGSSYSAFLYKNGLLVNAVMAGAGGQSAMPAEVAAMPSLNLTMLGAAPSFSIDFSNYSNVAVEAITPDVGTDNGFARKYDGLCGSWGKTSNIFSNTPGQSNGGVTTSLSGNIALSASITRGTPAAGSVVNYSVSSSSTSELPATLTVYIDNGSIPGELDASDVVLTTTPVSTTNQTYKATFFPYDKNILIHTKSSAGCIDNITKVVADVKILPVKLIDFSAVLQQSKPQFAWSVADNETGDRFELERSSDGKDFQTMALIFTSDKTGVENYSYKDSKELTSRTYYRLKIVNKDNTLSYSKVINLSPGGANKSGQITLLENPVSSSLQFSYTASTTQSGTINIYSITGTKLLSVQKQLQTGTNTLQLDLDSKFGTGTYLLEVRTNTGNAISKFVKR